MEMPVYLTGWSLMECCEKLPTKGCPGSAMPPSPGQMLEDHRQQGVPMVCVWLVTEPHTPRIKPLMLYLKGDREVTPVTQGEVVRHTDWKQTRPNHGPGLMP